MYTKDAAINNTKDAAIINKLWSLAKVRGKVESYTSQYGCPFILPPSTGLDRHTINGDLDSRHISKNSCSVIGKGACVAIYFNPSDFASLEGSINDGAYIPARY